MKYKTFSLRLPKDLTDAIDLEATKRFKKQNGRNQLITQILLVWHASKHAKREPQIEIAEASRKPKLATVNGG